MMTPNTLLQEFERLPTAEQLELIQAALRIVQAKFHQLEESPTEPSSLAQAAELLLEDYLDDPELTALTVLDGEPFHA
jgi:hypothetical protein